MWSHDYGLFNSLQLAGSSFGIVTEFHYRIYKGPETKPVFVVVYIENESDIQNFEAATNDGRYYLCLSTGYFFSSLKFPSLELLVRSLLISWRYISTKNIRCYIQ